MSKFRKKPVIVEAYQTDQMLLIPTLEGTMRALPGDWIITGVVAWGVLLPSGKCVIEWQTQFRSIAIYESPSEVVQVHGHEGRTILVWVDAA